MRILIYGMQSSGASLITYFLAQKKNTLALMDLRNTVLAPSEGNFSDFTNGDILLKCVVTSRYTFKEHLDSFRPNKTVLVLRNPCDNFTSLKTKHRYKNESGSVRDKFLRLNEEFMARNRFNVVISYEDFLRDHEQTVQAMLAVGISAQPNYYEFGRSIIEIKTFNRTNSRWCKENPRRWGAGNIHHQSAFKLDKKLIRKPCTERDQRLVERLCPELCAFYQKSIKVN